MLLFIIKASHLKFFPLLLLSVINNVYTFIRMLDTFVCWSVDAIALVYLWDPCICLKIYLSYVNTSKLTCVRLIIIPVKMIQTYTHHTPHTILPPHSQLSMGIKTLSLWFVCSYPKSAASKLQFVYSLPSAIHTVFFLAATHCVPMYFRTLWQTCKTHNTHWFYLYTPFCGIYV